MPTVLRYSQTVMQELDKTSKRCVNRFCRQVLQLERDVDYPPDVLLREEATQSIIYKVLIEDGAAKFPPPPRYQLRILKELVSRIENSIDDWDQYGVSDDLMSSLSELMVVPLPSEIAAAQQKSYVTYTLSELEEDELVDASRTPQITLLESRNTFAAGGTTGRRTWEASFILGQYLCANPCVVRGKRVLDLGAGTGYLSILATSLLGATQTIASDGSDDVVAHLPENFFLNGLQDNRNISVMDLKWGHPLVGTEEEKWNGGEPIDIVLGADITYDSSLVPALAGTFDEIFELFPKVEILIAAAERNRETFEKFLDICSKKGLKVLELDFPMTPRKDQRGPFYDDQVPIRICRVLR